MGLTARFYEKVTQVDHPPGHQPTEDCWASHEVAYTKDFPDQADGIEHHSCWVAAGESKRIHHSYSGYNQYRAWLCMAMYGVAPETVWDNLDDYRGRPFFWQIHFADNEGVMGGTTAAVLAKDYVEQRDYILDRITGMPQSFDITWAEHQDFIEMMLKSYDEWTAGFALAADDGMVMFG